MTHIGLVYTLEDIGMAVLEDASRRSGVPVKDLITVAHSVAGVPAISVQHRDGVTDVRRIYETDNS